MRDVQHVSSVVNRKLCAPLVRYCVHHDLKEPAGRAALQNWTVFTGFSGLKHCMCIEDTVWCAVQPRTTMNAQERHWLAGRPQNVLFYVKYCTVPHWSPASCTSVGQVPHLVQNVPAQPLVKPGHTLSKHDAERLKSLHVQKQHGYDEVNDVSWSFYTKVDDGFCNRNGRVDCT